MRKYLGKISAMGMVLLFLAAGITGCQNENQAQEAVSASTESEKEPEVAMAIGAESVLLEEVNVYAYFLKKQYDSGIGSEIWSYEIEEGTDFESYAKKQIQNLIAQVKVIKQEAAANNVVLTEDEKDEAESSAIAYLSEITDADKKAYALTRELVAKVYEDSLLAEKFYEVVTNDVDTNISDDEVREVIVQYLMVMTSGKDKEGNTVSLTEEEKKEVHKTARKLCRKAKKSENFLSLAQSNTDAEEVELTFTKEDMPEEFGEAAFALKTGEISEVIEGDSGYYILYCVSAGDSDSIKAKKEQLIRERQKEDFKKKYADWSKKYEVVISSAIWDKIQL